MHTRDSCRRMFEGLESESDSLSDGSEHEGSQQSNDSSLEEWNKNVREVIPSAKGGGSSAGHSRKRVWLPQNRRARARGVGHEDEPDVGDMDHQDVEQAATHTPPQGLKPGQRLRAVLESLDSSPNVARFQTRPNVEASVGEAELETELHLHRSSLDGEQDDSFGREIPIITSKWQIHNEKLHKNWLELRPALSAASLRVEALPAEGALCSRCGIETAILECLDCNLGLGVGQSCKPLLCAKCDIVVHPWAHFHRRQVWHTRSHRLPMASSCAFDHAMLHQQSPVTNKSPSPASSVPSATDGCADAYDEEPAAAT